MSTKHNMSKEAMQARLNELQQMEANDQLDDQSREELADMRSSMGM